MRGAWRIGLLAVLLILGGMAWRASAFDLQFRTATRAYRAGRYAEALERFIRAGAVSDAGSVVWVWIGDAAAAVYANPPSGGWDHDRADELLTASWGGYAGAVLRSPLDTWSWSGLSETAILRAERRNAEEGVDLAEVDRWSRGILDPWHGAALVAAKIAVELKPSGFQELDVLTRVYTSTGQLDAARETVVRSARIMPAPSFHTWGGGESLVKPLYDAIMSAMREGLERTPEFERSGLHHEIGRFALAQGDLDGALVEMRSAARVAEATHPDARYHAQRGEAEVLEAMGRVDDAAAAWSGVVESPLATSLDQRQRGIVLYRVGRKKDACRDLREALRDEPNDGSSRAFAAVACEEAGELDTAERLLREGFVLPIDDPVLARGLLDFYLRNDKRSTAEGMIRSWSRDFPERAEFRAWARELEMAQP